MNYPKYYKIIDDQIVTSNCAYITIEDSGITIINPTEEQILQAGWEIYTGQDLDEDELLQKTKDEVIEDIEYYDQSSEVNEFTINGMSMWLDHDVRQQLKNSIEAYKSTGQTQVTKIFGGQEYTFTVDQWLQMLALLEVYAAEALNTTERHKLTVEALTNIDEVLNYDFTTGYPTKLQF